MLYVLNRCCLVHVTYVMGLFGVTFPQGIRYCTITDIKEKNSLITQISKQFMLKYLNEFQLHTFIKSILNNTQIGISISSFPTNNKALLCD